jgi:anti-sigma factor RsiW
MTCKEFVEFVWKYLEGELPQDQRFTFDAHLSICPDCVNYLQNYGETVRLANEAFADEGAEVPDDVPEDLVRAILDAREP